MIGSSIIKNDAYAINDEVRYLKGKLLDQGRAPTFGQAAQPPPGPRADEGKAHQTLEIGKS